MPRPRKTTEQTIVELFGPCTLEEARSRLRMAQAIVGGREPAVRNVRKRKKAEPKADARTDPAEASPPWEETPESQG
jgi:hypothetical protein